MPVMMIKVESPGDVKIETDSGWVPQVGDTVVLKSGSPLMTVRELRNDGDLLLCDFFHPCGECKTFPFYKDQLRQGHMSSFQVN